MNSCLIINRLRLFVHLGCTATERETPQPVETDIEIFFVEGTKAIETDLLDDTFCYNDIMQTLKGAFEKDHFNLVEKLGFEIYKKIKSIAPPKTKIKVKVTKIQPPIPEIKGGVGFICGDLE